MIIKNSPEYQDFSIDTASEYASWKQKTQLQSLRITAADVVNFCGIFYPKWNYYYRSIYDRYQLVLTFNKIQQAERKREQLQQERAGCV